MMRKAVLGAAAAALASVVMTGCIDLVVIAEERRMPPSVVVGKWSWHAGDRWVLVVSHRDGVDGWTRDPVWVTGAAWAGCDLWDIWNPRTGSCTEATS